MTPAPRQDRTPILSAIQGYLGTTRIHMPGHKGGAGASRFIRELIGEKAFQADLVGVEGLDDYHAPSGCIAEAQALAAAAWGADHSFFVVNGTSCGLHALILSVCGPGDELIVPRTVHRSVVGALVLSQARPVFLQPMQEPTFGLPLGLAPDTVAQAIEDHPAARGVLIVSPTYHGVIPDVAAIAEAAHARGLPLLVDEAHGAHLGFHPDLPPSSITLGADGVAQGVHKTAGSLSQASMVHLKGDRLSVERVRAFLRLLQTTSPSYLLLASLDAARHFLVNEGRARLGEVLSLSGWIRAEVERRSGLKCLTASEGSFGIDPTRLTINVTGCDLCGHDLERRLRREYGVQIELSDLANIVLLLSIGDTRDAIDDFLEAMADLIARACGGLPPGGPTESVRRGLGACLPPTPPMALSPAEAFLRAARTVEPADARGLISGEMLAVYPPGIPAVYPGEVLTDAVVDYLLEARDLGLPIQGADDHRLRQLRIIDG